MLGGIECLKLSWKSFVDPFPDMVKPPVNRSGIAQKADGISANPFGGGFKKAFKACLDV